MCFCSTDFERIFPHLCNFKKKVEFCFVKNYFIDCKKQKWLSMMLKSHLWFGVFGKNSKTFINDLHKKNLLNSNEFENGIFSIFFLNFSWAICEKCHFKEDSAGKGKTDRNIQYAAQDFTYIKYKFIEIFWIWNIMKNCIFIVVSILL